VDSFNIAMSLFCSPVTLLFHLSFIAIALSCIGGLRYSHHGLMGVTIVLENSSDIILCPGNHGLHCKGTWEYWIHTTHKLLNKTVTFLRLLDTQSLDTKVLHLRHPRSPANMDVNWAMLGFASFPQTFLVNHGTMVPSDSSTAPPILTPTTSPIYIKFASSFSSHYPIGWQLR
jgi:hypothetical protein